MKTTLFDLSEYHTVAQDDIDCFIDLLLHTVSQLRLFIVIYEQALQENNPTKFRDNLHRMYPVFEMLKMKEITNLAQEGRELILVNMDDKPLITNHLDELKCIIFVIIENLEYQIENTKISG